MKIFNIVTFRILLGYIYIVTILYAVNDYNILGFLEKYEFELISMYQDMTM